MYWNGTGKLQNTYSKLQTLMPPMGQVESPQKNKALEKLRRASNCYYDLYNNGLCNKAKEFRQVFGFGGMSIVRMKCIEFKGLEDKITQFIIDAAIEQGLFN